MQTVKKEYAILFRAVTTAIEELNTIKAELMAAQLLAEDIFIGEEQPEDNSVPDPTAKSA